MAQSKTSEMTYEEIMKRVEVMEKYLLDNPYEDPTKGKSSEEIIEDLLNHEKKHSGIDWRAAHEGGHATLQEAYNKARQLGVEWRNTLSDDEVQNAINWGLLDKNGDVPVHPFLYEITTTDAAGYSSDTETFPIIATTRKLANKLRDAEGSDIEDQLKTFIRKLQDMKGGNAEQIAKIMFQLGIYGFGVLAVGAFSTAITTILAGAAITALSQAAVIAAIATGVGVIGVSLITGFIAVVVLAVLIPLFFMANKGAKGIMFILNDTDEDLVMSDYHVGHGKIITSFRMEADETSDVYHQTIKKRGGPIINPFTRRPAVFKKDGKTEVMEDMVYGGWYGVSKNNWALYGTQGAFRFAPTRSIPKGMYVSWCVPLSYDNTVYVSINSSSSIGDFADKANDDGHTNDVSTRGNTKLTGRVNSPRGTTAYYIIYLTSDN